MPTVIPGQRPVSAPSVYGFASRYMGQRSRVAPPLDPREVKRWGHHQGDVGSARAALDDRSNLLDPRHLQRAGERRGGVKILNARLFGSPAARKGVCGLFKTWGRKMDAGTEERREVRSHME